MFKILRNVTFKRVLYFTRTLKHGTEHAGLQLSNSKIGSLSEGLMHLIVHTTIANLIVIGVCDYTKK